MMGESQHSNIPVKISERKYNLQLSDEKKTNLRWQTGKSLVHRPPRVQVTTLGPTNLYVSSQAKVIFSLTE